MLAHLRAANAVAREAAALGHHPFGCVLVGPDDRILMRQGNIDTVRHAETELARRAADAYESDFLWSCTLVSPGEPCAMCTGTFYWANIGRLVYGFEETKLLALTGDHAENPTMSLPSRTVLGWPEEDRGLWPLPRDRGRADRAAPRFLEALTRWREPDCNVQPRLCRLAGDNHNTHRLALLTFGVISSICTLTPSLDHRLFKRLRFGLVLGGQHRAPMCFSNTLTT
ncbi:nucleoside deaminase [Mesorhizobium amorphae]|uniref:nucleoside deaminase n=1 Tax=Mesorhizobium amorphae TaxID=71433 RepID=UPI003D137AD3